MGKEDVSVWPFIGWYSGEDDSHWPSGDKDLGVGGVSYLELLILCELWAGERLICEKSTPVHSQGEQEEHLGLGCYSEPWSGDLEVV